MTLAQIIKKFVVAYGAKISLPYGQDLHMSEIYFFKIRFDIIVESTSRSPK
jgi:hypothetical protein